MFPYQAVLCFAVPLMLVFAGLNDRNFQLIKDFIMTFVFLVFFHDFQEFVMKSVPAYLHIKRTYICSLSQSV